MKLVLGEVCIIKNGCSVGTNWWGHLLIVEKINLTHVTFRFVDFNDGSHYTRDVSNDELDRKIEKIKL